MTGIEITPETTVTTYRLALTPAQANDLYNEVYVLFGDVGLGSVLERAGQFPTLSAFYDGLHAAGVDGTGPTATTR